MRSNKDNVDQAVLAVDVMQKESEYLRSICASYFYYYPFCNTRDHNKSVAMVCVMTKTLQSV